MKEIKLSNGAIAIVDDEDYESLSLHKWHPSKDRDLCYAIRASFSGGKRKTERMHRVIMGATDNETHVDHKNQNGLDNRKENLRLCTISQNRSNSRPNKNSSSQYKGVTKDHPNKWLAQITVNYKNHNLGRFKIEKDAALAYDKAAYKYFKEFAYLNFPKKKKKE